MTQKISLRRDTHETQIQLELAQGEGGSVVDTGLPFFDHMLVTLSRYAGLSLTLTARWDLRHHGMEDVAIALGCALLRLQPSAAARYGERTVPMDDALVQACVDLGGRFYYRGQLPKRLYAHVLRSMAEQAKMTLHLRVLRGQDPHHIVEAAFKATGLALRQALAQGGDAVFSTKGSVRWTEG